MGGRQQESEGFVGWGDRQIWRGVGGEEWAGIIGQQTRELPGPEL